MLFAILKSPVSPQLVKKVVGHLGSRQANRSCSDTPQIWLLVLCCTCTRGSLLGSGGTCKNEEWAMDFLHKQVILLFYVTSHLLFLLVIHLRVTFHSCHGHLLPLLVIHLQVTFYFCWSATCKAAAARRQQWRRYCRLFCHCTYVYCVSIFVLSMPPWSPILPFLPFLLFHYLERLLSDSFGFFYC